MTAKFLAPFAAITLAVAYVVLSPPRPVHAPATPQPIVRPCDPATGTVTATVRTYAVGDRVRVTEEGSACAGHEGVIAAVNAHRIDAYTVEVYGVGHCFDGRDLAPVEGK